MEMIIALLVIAALVTPFLGIAAFIIALQNRNRLNRLELQLLSKPVNREKNEVSARPPIQPKAEPTSTPPAQKPIAAPAPAKTIPQTPPPPPVPASHAPASRRVASEIEARFAGNWMVWLAGLALMVGGILLIRVAIEAGFFGPGMRVFFAFLAGAVMLAGSEWARRQKLITKAGNMLVFLPIILASAGIVTLFAASFAGGMLYGFFPPLVTFGLYVAIAILAVILGLIHGFWLPVLGLSGAYMAPMLTGAEGSSVLPILPYSIAITLAALALIRFLQWRVIRWVGLVGFIFWGALAMNQLHKPFMPIGLASYGLFASLIAILASWGKAQDAPDYDQRIYQWLSKFFSQAETVLTVYAFSLAGGIFAISAALDSGVEIPVMFIAFSLCAIWLIAAWRQAGLEILPLFSLATALLLFDGWPIQIDPNLLPQNIDNGFVEPLRPNQHYLYYAWGSGLLFSVFAGWVLPKLQLRLPMAILFGFLPLGILLISFNHYADMDQRGYFWGLGALLLASIYLAYLEWMQRHLGKLETLPGTAAVIALASMSCAASAIFLAFEDIWQPLAFALLALGNALLHRRFALPALQYIAALCAIYTTFQMSLPDFILDYEISALPILNQISFAYGLAILSFWLAARYFRQSGAKPMITDGLEAGALVLLFVQIALHIRHIASEGDLAAPSISVIAESSAYAIAYLGMALAFVRRFAQPRRFLLFFEIGALIIGLSAWGAALFAGLPLNGAPGYPIINMLIPAALLPALLMMAYAHGLQRRQWPLWCKRGLGILAGAMLFIYVTLETRRMFTGTNIDTGVIADAERWTYSGVWLIFALTLLLLGTGLRSLTLRLSSLAVLMIVILKVFILDLAGLDGVLRATSFLLLGAVLIGVALFYQKVVFRNSNEEADKEDMSAA